MADKGLQMTDRLREILRKLVGRTTNTLYKGVSEKDMWDIDEARQAIIELVAENKKYANVDADKPEDIVIPQDDRDYEPAFVEGWNAHREATLKNMEKE